MKALEVGAKAPDFELEGTGGKTIRLSEVLREGKPVVLAFFPAAWSPVCGDEMTLFQEIHDEFERLGARIVGISVDTTWTLDAWAQSKGLTFPLLADFHPQGAVGKTYGIQMDNGMDGRALFVVDPQGVIRYSHLSPPEKNPGADGVLDALEEMQQGDKA